MTTKRKVVLRPPPELLAKIKQKQQAEPTPPPATPQQHPIWDRIKNRVEGQFPRSLDHDSGLMEIMLPPAIFLWQSEFMHLSFDERSEILKECDKDLWECSEALVKGRGKPGQVARGFNALAKSLALLSFQPGGCHAFGHHWLAESLTQC